MENDKMTPNQSNESSKEEKKDLLTNDQAAENQSDDVSQESVESVEQKEQPTDDQPKKEEVEETAPEEVVAEETEVVAEESSTKKDEEPAQEPVAEASETEEEHEDEEEEEIDYSHLSKKELVEIIKELAKEENKFAKVDRILKEIKPVYDEIFNSEKQAALDKFLADGGEAADFEYKLDELDNRFDANYQLIKDKRNKFYKEQERQKDENLRRKNELLDKLRGLVDGEETVTSLSALKEIQTEWKSIGPVQNQHNKSLWANYNILIDRFYDNRSIHFELKELDRKKNLEAKLELCAKAERLANQEDVRQAIQDLNNLHDEFKHIGPVPAEEQENIWKRFKAASDQIYDKRKDFVKELKKDLEVNLEKKKVLVEKVLAFADFSSDRIKLWNQKTKEILEIQKQWDAIGGLPRESSKEVNRLFWNSFKKFFSSKHHFFKDLEKERAENLEKKKALVEKAKEAAASEELDKAKEQLKQLQVQWKEIGPVPEKFRDSIYQEFKEACDSFFNKLRANSSESEKEYHENLKQKQEVCKAIEQLAKDEPNSIEKLEALEAEYSKIGFVPRNHVKSIKEQFTKAVEHYLAVSTDLTDADKAKVKLMTQLTKMKAGPNANRKLNQKELSIRKRITDLQNEITTWKNNLEFFAASKTADKLKEEFDGKIADAQREVKKLKEQLKLVRSM